MASLAIKGIHEVNRAFARIERRAQKELLDEMVRRAGPVAETSKAKIGRYQGARTSTIRAAKARGGAVVRQGAGSKHTRPNFGGLQIGLMLEAISEHAADIYKGIDNMLDDEIRKAGF